MRTQCKLLGIARSTLDYTPVEESAEDLVIMRVLDELYLLDPCMGQRKLVVVLARDHGLVVNRKRLRRLRELMGQQTIYRMPRTSLGNKEHRIYPYLMRQRVTSRPNQAWCADITYIPMKRGYAYLCVVMDWYSRKVLGWSLTNTQDTAFCLEALDEAIAQERCVPEVFNTDQGCQFTSAEWIARLRDKEVTISMDGKGRYLDNIFIERLWRTLKHDHIYLHEYATMVELRASIAVWIRRYNGYRPHQHLGQLTPAQVHAGAAIPAPKPPEQLQGQAA
jgi:putative transposase